MLVNQRRSLIVAAGLLAGAVLVGLLLLVSPTDHLIKSWDEATWSFANRLRNRPATLVAEGFAFAGSGWVNGPLRVAVLALLAWRRRWVQLAAFALAVVTSEILVNVLKHAYDRPRPPGAIIATTGASFPSGHAIAGAVTAVGLVIVLLPPGRSRLRWEIGAVAFAFLMALSRVYLAAHWLSDVVAGALLGAGLALGFPALLMAVRSRLTTARASPEASRAHAAEGRAAPTEASRVRAAGADSVDPSGGVREDWSGVHRPPGGEAVS